jgi:mannose-6-phosphate isomerase-like protein (cupin superfamily)
MFRLAALGIITVATPALAQTPRRGTEVVRVSGGAIDSAFRALAATPGANARDLPTGALDRYQLIVLARRAVELAELHERWTDVVLVRSGSATLRTGPSLVGRRQSDPGEWHGSGIEKARDQRVGPGDVLIIPAGMAHQWRPSGQQAFAYILLKIRPGAAPAS